MDAWEQEMQMEQLKTQVMEASEKQQALREEKHAAQREVAELKVTITILYTAKNFHSRHFNGGLGTSEGKRDEVR